jgi:hypothetical protein
MLMPPFVAAPAHPVELLDSPNTIPFETAPQTAWLE